MLLSRQLNAFYQVVVHQSFDIAAQKLYITPSALSQRIKQLETSMGQTLLIRSNPVQMTPSGITLMQYAKQMMALNDAAQFQLLEPKNLQQEVVLSIGVNADSLSTWFYPALNRLFEDENCLIDIRIADQDQTLDFMRKGEVIACISSDPNPIQGALSIPLGVMTYQAFATPQFNQRYFPNGVTPSALMKAPTAIYNQKDELTSDYLKQYFALDTAQTRHHVMPSSEGFLQMGLSGHAWVLLPIIQATQAVQSGQLINITPDKQCDISLYWHHWDLPSFHLKQLTVQVSKVAQQTLCQIL